ncbi:MAG: lysophospholipid acyltransferase family protein [Leptolyngbyaceae bacterium]|nr:lysophospholipid acyltransferase family protein [Leptolyngbyaceae bacterium]
MDNKAPDFYPPQLHPLLVRVFQILAPIVTHFQYRVDLKVSADSLEKMRGLRDQRCLMLPNHPTFHDPIVIFLLSGRLKQPFYYLAAYEQFKGFFRYFFPKVGVYSIRRGLADRASIAQTLELLTQPQCHLVIFAEGGCSFQNDTVMPFRSGAVQMAFQAMNKWVKQGEPVPDLYVVPISIKYRYTEDMTQVIDQTLSRLETALQVPTAPSPYERLRAIAERVLVSLELDYELHTPDTSQQPWNERILKLRSHILECCEQKLSLPTNLGEPVRERVYKILYALESKAATLETKGIWSPDFIYQAMMRLLNFDAIYDGYVAADPTPERFLDTLTRLEREVFKIDQPVPKGHRQALLQVGEPINLKAHFEQYQKNRTGTVNTLVDQLHQTVQENLNLLIKANSP